MPLLPPNRMLTAESGFVTLSDEDSPEGPRRRVPRLPWLPQETRQWPRRGVRVGDLWLSARASPPGKAKGGAQATVVVIDRHRAKAGNYAYGAPTVLQQVWPAARPRKVSWPEA